MLGQGLLPHLMMASIQCLLFVPMARAWNSCCPVGTASKGRASLLLMALCMATSGLVEITMALAPMLMWMVILPLPQAASMTMMMPMLPSSTSMYSAHALY